MMLPVLPSPAVFLLFLFQDDASAPASVPVGSPGTALLEMVRNSGPVAFAVLIILLLASIFSWALMLSKWRAFGRARRESAGFLRVFRKSGRLSEPLFLDVVPVRFGVGGDQSCHVPLILSPFGYATYRGS